tara:strand:- start:241 stop:498 length:258 start_codon:yes stop_codon:yes gene_type:complete
MATITVEITDSEFKALEHIAVDPAGWIKEFVLHRAFVATEDIVSLVTTHCLDNELTIPSTREAMITFAYENKIIEKAADQNTSPE